MLLTTLAAYHVVVLLVVFLDQWVVVVPIMVLSLEIFLLCLLSLPLFLLCTCLLLLCSHVLPNPSINYLTFSVMLVILLLLLSLSQLFVEFPLLSVLLKCTSGNQTSQNFRCLNSTVEVIVNLYFLFIG